MKLNLALLLTIAGALAACSENTIAPTTIDAAAVAPSVEGSSQALVGTDTIKFSITIDPSRNTTFYLGAGNSLYFPAGSLCATNSSYGQGQWDKPCSKAYSPVTVNVKAWLNASGKPRVDFDKHIRFAPTNDPSKYVVIQFADLQASLDPFFNILYCPQVNSECINEAKTDLSLVTVRNPITGKVTRRIKHFSGYNVAAGEEAAGLFNMMGNAPNMSISADDFRFDSIDALRNRYNVSDSDAQQMLDRIRAGRGLSGYILASGYEQ
jgi:hypothetical protein